MSNHFRIIHLAAVATALATAVGVAACGGSLRAVAARQATGRHASVANASAANVPSANLDHGAFEYAACMRAHGVSNFPDPRVHQSGRTVSVIIHLTPAIKQSSAFPAAQQTCGKYMVGDAEAQRLIAAAIQTQRRAALAFANCMRSQGFPSFPAPTAEGQLTPEMVTAAGIDLHQPALLHAGLTCVPVTHGLLTTQDIERAVNGG